MGPSAAPTKLAQPSSQAAATEPTSVHDNAAPPTPVLGEHDTVVTAVPSVATRRSLVVAKANVEPRVASRGSASNLEWLPTADPSLAAGRRCAAPPHRSCEPLAQSARPQETCAPTRHGHPAAIVHPRPSKYEHRRATGDCQPTKSDCHLWTAGCRLRTDGRRRSTDERRLLVRRQAVRSGR